MHKSNLRLVPPSKTNRTVTPLRRPNAAIRPREHLTEADVDKLIDAAKDNRHGRRDALMVLLTFRHGLRASELVGLEWSSVDFDKATIFVRRAKGGTPGTHPLSGEELRALRALKREGQGAFVFESERGAPFSPAGFAKMVARAGIAAEMPWPCHPHQLRHACGYALANKGTDTRTLQGYMGHASIQSTVGYTALAPNRFKDLWR